ncbi:Sin-like protein conserved region-domain-containing protein [Catenaria anguillulae PL171]|uniref:Sin-like protein conserved region-domain-containing protein n=1 Tax=Catenaria anguillulae PL171 TaxID=765915 RepID=A0A1Y2HQT4_9FUNG|nr:Sin-like protein conserved region-domain-containing protein [Catenaria anguillulae PL171]
MQSKTMATTRPRHSSQLADPTAAPSAAIKPDIDHFGPDAPNGEDSSDMDIDSQPHLLPPFVDDDPSDPIVKELPVYLTSTLLNHLHLFQFPIRNRRFTPESGPATARIKPKSRAIELDIPLNTVSPSYDQDLGVQFGGNAQLPRTVYDQQSSDDLNLFATTQQQVVTKKLEALTLASTTVPPMTQYYTAAIRNDEVHLTPITSTLQFTPKLKHIDDLSRADRDAKKRIDEESKRARGELTDKKPSAAAALPRIITDDMKQAMQRSVAYMKKEQDEEPFVPLRYYLDQTDEADQVYGSLFARWKKPIGVQGQPADYLSVLAPPSAAPIAAAASDASAPGTATKPVTHIAGLVRKPGSVTRQDLKAMSLEEQVACLMANAHILPLDAIVSALPKGTPLDLLLVTLRQLAIPVRAQLWVAKSELVYKGRERFARDYLIGMYLKGATRAVRRKDFADVARLDVETVKQLLSDVAELRQPAAGSSQGPMWYLKHLDSLPVEEQGLMHEAIHEFETGAYQTALKELGLIQSVVAPPAAMSARARSTAATRSGAPPAAANAPAVALGAQPVADPVSQSIIQLLLTHGVVTTATMHAHLSTTHAGTSDVEVAAKLNTLCFQYHDAYALKTRPGSKYEAFRQVALELFSKSPAVKKNDLIKTFKDRTGKDIAVKAFEEVVAELAAARDKTSKKPYLWKTATE